MRAGTKRRGGLFLGMLCLIAVGGAVFGGTVSRTPLIGALAGVINGVMVLGAIVGAEMFLPQTRLGHALERAPFLVTFAVRFFVYHALILVVIGSNLGRQLVIAVLPIGDPVPAAGEQAWRLPPKVAIVVTAMFLPPFILLTQLTRLIGERTLRDIVLGRYHRPRTEERFFLFVDIAGSTPLAERIGPAAVHRFLGRVFRIASAPIDDHGGEVYQYVGDEMVITWTASAARQRARPLACFFAIAQALERAALEFERDFGVTPRLRAALHAGPVIAGEVGESRRAIVFHGDVMNTASRLEQASRDLERRFLVSGDALERLDGLAAYALEDLSLRRLRGRAEPVHVYAVTTKP